MPVSPSSRDSACGEQASSGNVQCISDGSFFPSEMYLCMGDVFAHWRCICALEMYLRIADVFANVFFVWRVFGI